MDNNRYNELIDNLMKVVERLSNKENATAEEITALAAVADSINTLMFV